MRAHIAPPFSLPIVAPGAPAMPPGQTDEIQVCDAAITEPGIFNPMIHTNFRPIGWLSN